MQCSGQAVLDPPVVGQAVERNSALRINFGASDPRKDGAAVAQLLPFS